MKLRSGLQIDHGPPIGRSPFIVLLVLVAISCGTAKEGLTSGSYRTTKGGYMVQVEDDLLCLRPESDRTDTAIIRYPVAVLRDSTPPPLVLVRPGFDVDLLTTLLKFRPAADRIPPSVETQLSGALYLGYRWDRYALRYPDYGFVRRMRTTSHLGVSVGAFAGLSGAPIAPWFTRDQVSSEYTGVTFSSGVALIGAVGNTTLGVSIGNDRLLNEDHAYWIYQRQWWLGIVFGLNLN